MSEVRRLAAVVAELQGKVSSLARERRLANASMEGGSISVYQPGTAGAPGVQLGQQWDGTYGQVPLGGPKPPIPTAPTVTSAIETLVVAWDGTWAAGEYTVAPMDFSRVEVHVGDSPGFDGLSSASLRGTIESPRGGQFAVVGLPPGVDFWVRLTARSTSGKASEPSALAGPVRVLAATDSDDGIPPPTPSTPVVSSYLGQLRIFWDGLAAGGGDMPADFNLVEVHVSASSGFTPSEATLITSLSTGGAAFATAPYAATRYVRLVAVDRAGNRSPASAEASGTSAKVVADDVFDGAIGSEKLADLAVVTAKIADLAVNDAKIGSLSAGKITAGTINADVIISGRFATAPDQARVELNSLGLQKFASDGVTKLVSITGTEALMSGVYRSNPSGQRVEINGAFSRYDSSTPGTYYAGMRMFVGASGSAFGEIATWSSGSDFYTLQMISPVAGPFNGAFLRLQGAGLSPDNDSAIMHASNNVRISALQTVALSSNGPMSLSSGGNTMSLSSPLVQFSNADGTLSVNRGKGSPFLVFNGYGIGGGGGILGLKVLTASDGYGTGLSILDSGDSTYYNLRVGAVLQLSDESVKRNVTPASSLLAEIAGTRVVEYDVVDSKGKPAGARRRGVLASEAPEGVRVPGNPDATGADALDMIDLYAMAATCWGALREVEQRLTALEGRKP